MDHVDFFVPQEAPSTPQLSKNEAWNEDHFPARPAQVHYYATVIDQGFQPSRRVAIPDDLNPIENFTETCPRCPGHNGNYAKPPGKSAGKLVHEAWLMITNPTRIG
jgi:hypothetical protein